MHPKTLYRVTVGSKNTQYSLYVIANDAQEAYDKLKKYLDDNNIYFSAERKLKSVEVVGGESGTGIFE